MRKPDKVPNEQSYQDVFICDQTENWHDFYYEAAEKPDLQDMIYRLNRAGIELCMPSVFVVERSTATQFSIIVCVIAGEGFLTVEGKHYLLRKGAVFILPPHVAHGYRSNPSNPFGLVWMEFCGGDSACLMEHIVSLHTPVLEGAICQKVSAKIATMIQKVEQGGCTVALEIYDILLTLLQHRAIAPCQIVVAQPLEQALIYIDAHVGEAIINAQLAQACHMSKANFLRLFQEKCRITPRQYVLQKKVEIAKHALLYTEDSVEKIADQLGFSSPSHFVRVFKKVTETTPKQYRLQGKIFRL